MKTTRDKAIAFLKSLGVPNPKKSTNKKLEKRLSQVPDKIDEADVPDSQVDFYTEICDAVEGGGKVSIVDESELEDEEPEDEEEPDEEPDEEESEDTDEEDTDEEEEEEEKSSSKKKKPKKKVVKKATKKTSKKTPAKKAATKKTVAKKTAKKKNTEAKDPRPGTKTAKIWGWLDKWTEKGKRPSYTKTIEKFSESLGKNTVAGAYVRWTQTRFPK